MAEQLVYFHQYMTAPGQIDRVAELPGYDMVVESVVYSLLDTAAWKWDLGQLFPDNAA